MIDCYYVIEFSGHNLYIARRTKSDNYLLTVYNSFEQFLSRCELHDFNLYNEDKNSVKQVEDEIKNKYPEWLV